METRHPIDRRLCGYLSDGVQTLIEAGVHGSSRGARIIARSRSHVDNLKELVISEQPRPLALKDLLNSPSSERGDSEAP
jgi:hypothetical protein